MPYQILCFDRLPAFPPLLSDFIGSFAAAGFARRFLPPKATVFCRAGIPHIKTPALAN